MSFDAVANGKLDTLLANLPSAPKVSGAGFQIYVDSALPLGLTSGGSVWANGAYAQVIASTAQAVYLAGISMAPSGAAVSGYQVDIATGASGSEVVVASLPLPVITNAGLGETVFFPALIPIAASTRVAARLRASGASATLALYLIYVQQANWSGV